MRTITALSLAALAEAATPYGIEAFDCVLKPLWIGTRAHHGKVRAAALNPQPSTLNPQTLNPQPSTLPPQPSTLNPQPYTLKPADTRNTGPQDFNP